MQAPCHLDVIESCVSCKLRANRSFCNLPRAALQSFEAIKGAMAYPDHAVLFLEGQTSRGVFILCQGQVKLSMSSSNGKTLILRVAEAGELLGLSATIAGNPYEQTAETIGPCQAGFVRRDDFLRFVRKHNDACFRVAEQLSGNYNSACRGIRSLGLSHSAAEKLARLLLEFSAKDGHAQRLMPGLLSGLTHEETAQMIGVSRETVTRLFSALKDRHILRATGSSLVISNQSALRRIARTDGGAGEALEDRCRQNARRRAA